MEQAGHVEKVKSEEQKKEGRLDCISCSLFHADTKLIDSHALRTNCGSFLCIMLQIGCPYEFQLYSRSCDA